MSYILDAIRKSDLQRQRSAAPTLLTAHADPDASKPPLAAIYVAGAAALLAAGIAIGWWRPWAAPQNETPVAAPVAVASPPPAVVVVPIPPPLRIEREVVIAKPPAAAAATAPVAPVVAPATPAPPVAPPSPPTNQAPAAARTRVGAAALSPVDRATV